MGSIRVDGGRRDSIKVDGGRCTSIEVEGGRLGPLGSIQVN